MAGCGGGGGGGSTTTAPITPTEDVPIVPAVNTHLSAQINEYTFTGTSAVGFCFDTMTGGAQVITAAAADDNWAISKISLGFSVQIPVSVPATYTLGNQNVGIIGYSGNGTPTTLYSDSGTVTITYYSSTRIVGTFAFSAPDGANRIKVMTGSFDLPYSNTKSMPTLQTKNF
jgi:hypothetical protein